MSERVIVWCVHFCPLFRLDSCSSDAMSVALTSSSTAMDTSSVRCISSSSQSTPSAAVSASHGPTLKQPTTADSSSQAVSLPVSGQAVESLRWDTICSDEEKEEERISRYKQNRRKRYENALSESQLNRTAKTAIHYGFTSSSPPPTEA